MEIKTCIYRISFNSLKLASKVTRAGIKMSNKSKLQRSLVNFQRKINLAKNNIKNRLSLSPLMDNWNPSKRIELQNIIGKGIVSLQRYPRFLNPLKLKILYEGNQVGYMKLFVRKDRFELTDIEIAAEGMGIGSTICNWLSLQAQKENKFIIYNNITKPRLVNLAFIYLSDIKIRRGRIWVTKTKEYITRIIEKMEERVDIKGRPKPYQVLKN